MMVMVIMMVTLMVMMVMVMMMVMMMVMVVIAYTSGVRVYSGIPSLLYLSLGNVGSFF